MILQTSIDEVLSLDVTDVIGKYVKLTPKGNNHQGNCPFHKEKTPSFSVSPSKGFYKCFGCGKHGNAIGFVMDYKKIDFLSAVKAIATDHNITLLEEPRSKEASIKFNRNEQLYTANKIALEWFQENLRSKENEPAHAYVLGRWNQETITDFGIGFAPEGWDGLKNFAKSKGVTEDILLETGLLSESKGKRFDYFRGRIMFPILSATGRVVGFTGRNFSGNETASKYFNTPQTGIYNKGKTLYGLHMAAKEIKERGFAYLVEGNADVIRLHQIGKINTVGSGGTALTREQIAELKNRVASVTLIGDSDGAGQTAVLKSGKLIIEAGMFCNVIELPKGAEKQDPDSFFQDGEQFDQYAGEHQKDFIIWQAESQKEKCKSPDEKSKVIDELSWLITRLPVSSHTLYIEQLSAKIKPKRAWEDSIRRFLADEPRQEKKEPESAIPSHVILSDYEKYGFYQDHNCYYFRTKNGPLRGCNFIMEPLFHVASVLNSKRIYRITNEHGYSQVIELLQKDLISISAFKLRVESLGNFLFEGTDADLNKLKRFLYEKTESCTEITQLGWQKEGFWAWSNGIFDGEYKETDLNGIVVHKGKNYYLPSSSGIYKSEETLFVSERRFRHSPGKVSLFDYSSGLLQVYGDNAMFGLCFYFATLFRDHIAGQFGFFPILNLFGPKGAGKTEMAISLLQLFGNQAKGPNITNTTKAALADHVAMFSNALCHIDEYKNNLEYEKIEFLKGLWDGTGRTRMNMDKDKKKETTSVYVGNMVSGQEMTTADIALFSRMIYLWFNKVEFNEKEKAAFNDLKAIEKHGLTHITHQILQHRSKFTQHYRENYDLASDELGKMLNGMVIEDRIFRNWLVIIAAYRTLKEEINVPWGYDDLLKIAAGKIILQNKETKWILRSN
ncbi:MAG: DNA primase [Bacteroidota bacterium]